jgi:hypothetical protein
MLYFTAKRIKYEGNWPLSNALDKQNEPLETRAIIQTNIRVSCGQSHGKLPWKSESSRWQ